MITGDPLKSGNRKLQVVEISKKFEEYDIATIFVILSYFKLAVIHFLFMKYKRRFYINYRKYPR